MTLDVEPWQCDSFGGITFTFSAHANTSTILARVRAVNLGIILVFLHQTEVEHTARLGIGRTSARILLYRAVRGEKEQTEIIARWAGRQAGRQYINK